MLDTFKARLKAKLKTLGVNLSQKRIDAIADRLHKKSPDITEETDHDTRIEELNELQPFDEIAKLDDKVRTLENKAKPPATKKLESDDDDDSDDDDAGEEKKLGKKEEKKPSSDRMPKWAKELTGKIEALTKDKTQSSMQSRMTTKLKDKVPASYYKGRALPENEADFDEFVAQIETDYTEFTQELVNENLKVTTGKPAGGGDGGIVKSSGKEEADIKSWAEKGKPKEKETAKK